MQTLREQIPGIAEAGFTAIWLPPPSDAVSAQGYLPRDYYNLNSKYGTEAELRQLLAVMHENGVKAIADIVINHRCAHFQVCTARPITVVRCCLFYARDWHQGHCFCPHRPQMCTCPGCCTCKVVQALSLCKLIFQASNINRRVDCSNTDGAMSSEDSAHWLLLWLTKGLLATMHALLLA